jgi:pyruvate,orthophosphate dikinase
LPAQIDKGIAELEAAIGKKFGDKTNPLLSFCSLGRPGVDAWHDGYHLESGPQRRNRRGPHREHGQCERFAYDSYRRFIQMYGNVVLGMKHHDFEHILDGLKKSKGGYRRPRARRRRSQEADRRIQS